ncbi:ADP-ribosylglycohydrolase family protein [Rodentibacter heidelbergensis]|uniref:ADP-ribosylglycohydrolase n=1 Tax=Rodentibacter heidelbergensis TaxID=1908258 RepID=A0A1V3IA32_9PAST|nr:ADP-ribosylglycohydrolase family protein [Rodentibacter heidelbergensis]OOF36897.1 hypothetical protein BKK48_03520 [Rodentibacter heidelbergensis]
MFYLDQVRSALFGISVADALGVPAEFMDRASLKATPITGMQSGGIHNQEIGTWSDDSSLTFCLADNLELDFNLEKIANSFLKWVEEDYWRPRGEIFDIGVATRKSIFNIYTGVLPELSGGESELDNGNGALMRILPLVFFTFDKNIDERFTYTKKIVSITHRHIRSIIACFYYLEFARYLLKGLDKLDSYMCLQKEIPDYLARLNISKTEIDMFDRLFKQNIAQFNEDEIESSGYVLHTLEASIWCLLNNNDYSSTVLNAVNLGEDSDTTAAVAGGLAGLLYGIDSIPQEWMNVLAKKEDIEQLSKKFFNAMKR